MQSRTKKLLIVLGAVCVIVGFVVSGEDPTHHRSSALTDEESAKYACQYAVEQSLHDPKSAEFDDARTFPSKRKGDHIVVLVRLRARNGFNALRQTEVGCTAELRDATWVAKSLTEAH